VEVDGDPASTEVKVTLSNSDYFINADVSLLPPGARAALIGWLGCVEAPGSHIRDDRGVCT